MYTIDLSSKEKRFDEDLHLKVLRETCAGARQKIWKTNPEFVFTVKGVPTTKKTPSSALKPPKGKQSTTTTASTINTANPILQSNSSTSISPHSTTTTNSDAFNVDFSFTNATLEAQVSNLPGFGTLSTDQTLEFENEETQFMEEN